MFSVYNEYLLYLYIEKLQGARMADLWANGNWEFNFGRHFNDWEMDSVQQF